MHVPVEEPAAIAGLSKLLICPDCRQSLDDAMSCSICRRSLAPEADGIINAMPREFDYAAQMNDLQAQIDQSLDLNRVNRVVRFEQAFHDEQAAYYDAMNSDLEPMKTYIRTLVQKHVYGRINRCDFVVDLCCGTGKGSLPLIDRGMRVVGLDVSREMLRVYAHKTAKRDKLHLIQADATQPPLRPDSCPAIQMIGGLHHIPDQEASVHNCCQALSKNGFLIVHEPLKTGEAHWMLGVLRNLDAITNPPRIARTIGRRLRLYRPSKPIASPERLDFTPYERSFTSAQELSAIVPTSMEIVELGSKLVLSDWQFGPHLQPFRSLAGAVVFLDEWLSKSGRAGWSGNALFGVFRKL